MPDFLGELWNRKADVESGEIEPEYTSVERGPAEIKTRTENAAENANVAIYNSVKSKIEHDPDLMEMFQQVEDAGLRYWNTIDHMELVARTNKSFEDRHLNEMADHDRRVAHEALIADVKAFNRAANKRGIDISEMKSIVLDGNVRKKIQMWMRDVLNYLGKRADQA